MQQRIAQFLQAENISPAQFADRIGVQRSGISHILSGRNKPGFDFIEKTLHYFPALNAEWLITGRGRMYKELTQASLFPGMPADPPAAAGAVPADTASTAAAPIVSGTAEPTTTNGVPIPGQIPGQIPSQIPNSATNPVPNPVPNAVPNQTANQVQNRASLPPSSEIHTPQVAARIPFPVPAYIPSVTPVIPSETLIPQAVRTETPTVSTAPVAPTIPTAPVAPTAPTAPVVPTIPTAPVAPTIPTAPVAPTAPTAPVAQTIPTAPVAPTAPTAPVAPTAPTAPVAPTAPTAPVAQTIPTAPVAPTAPTAPVAPTILSAALHYASPSPAGSCPTQETSPAPSKDTNTTYTKDTERTLTKIILIYSDKSFESFSV